MRNILKVWLTKNELTPDPNDFSATLSSMGSVNFDHVIDELMAEDTEYKRETVVDIVSRFLRVVSRLVLNGYLVNIGLAYLKAVVTGPFYGKKFDPARNSVYVSITQGADLRKEAAITDVEVLGEKPDMMSILQVTNLVTKRADGHLTAGRNAQVDGTYIKLAGDQPEVGVYFVNQSNGEEVKLTWEDIVTNDPSKLILFVPADITPGMYHLKIVSQYTTGARMLKSIRQVEYEMELQIG